MEQDNNVTSLSSLPKQNISKVWYASDKKIKNLFGGLVFDDRGILEVFNSSLHFSGKKFNINMKNIRNISLIKQIRLRKFFLLYHIVGILLFLTISWEIFANFPSLIIIEGIIILTILNIVGNRKWVCVEYVDENGSTQKAYFADGLWIGWHGIFGGTKKLYELLKKV